MKLFRDILLVFLLLVYEVQCKVSLRVFLKPPIVTLECLIINAIPKTSTIMMCPNDLMCFKNCQRLCFDDCITNVIKCNMKHIMNGIKYTYTFDSSNPRNQGEWTCHFGDQQSSTVIFLNKTNVISTTPLTTKKSFVKSQQLFTSPVPTSKTPGSKAIVSKVLKTRGRILANETYVITLLILFGISFCLNILLISRGMFYKVLSNKSIIPNNLKQKSCILKLLKKLFCVKETIEIKTNKENNYIYEDNPIYPRQLSSNIYECTGSSQLQPAILLDNYAFLGTPTNQRMFPTNIYARSQSFPAKYADPRINGKKVSNKSFTSTKVQSQSNESKSKAELIGQIIYDDVADSSLTYMPLNFFDQVSPYCRPSQYISINPNYHQNCSTPTMSLNNLAVTSFRLPNGSVDCGNTNEDNILKYAINSRVELSKEMINQADTLLKKADTLLNEKEIPNISITN